MSTAFSFFLRLFLCFVAAKFLLQAIGVQGRDYLVSLTAVFLVNIYVLEVLVFRDRTPSGEADRRPPAGPAEAPPAKAAAAGSEAPPEVKSPGPPAQSK
ncbi:MAG: hypothetical protein WC443_00410 [Desulfobaccales bacterium]